MSNICAPALYDIWKKEIITQKSFTNNLTLMNVTPVIKKEDALLLKNYRPVSVLQIVSKTNFISSLMWTQKRVQYTNGSNIHS